MTLLTTINASTPFLIGVPNSKVSPEWIRAILAVVAAINTVTVTSGDDFQTLLITQRTPINQSPALSDLNNILNGQQNLKTQIASLTNRVVDLETQFSTMRKKTASASAGQLAAYGAGANGFDTAGHAQALYQQVIDIRNALVANGIMT